MDVRLVNYKVSGIKNLENPISLSFYKKTITNPINFQEYNVKGIYGMNGSGKSAIITSVEILKNLLIDESYLHNPIVQEELDSIINKKTKELYIEVEYLEKKKQTKTEDRTDKDRVHLYQYKVLLKKNQAGKYCIGSEQLSYKPATSKKAGFNPLIEVKDGEVELNSMERQNFLVKIFVKRTMNLLSSATMSALLPRTVFLDNELADQKVGIVVFGIFTLLVLGISIEVYMDQSDYHTRYLFDKQSKHSISKDADESEFLLTLNGVKRNFTNSQEFLEYFSFGAVVSKNIVLKKHYKKFHAKVERLKAFLQIFKTDLLDIEIERKENGDDYICELNMVYTTCTVNLEFESTGIKKLVKLFSYIERMVEGSIVFIDEFDANLHDVYLCALLEYLMEYGKGQLCFTTHNVGPMDVLRRRKKSIDFLSVDHKIYPWTTSGNYSPSKLYKNGMIQGSPFNVDSIDFIRVFGYADEEN